MTPKKRFWTIAVAAVVFIALAAGALALQNSVVNGEGSSGTSLTPVAVPLETTEFSESSAGDASSSSSASSDTSSQSVSSSSVPSASQEQSSSTSSAPSSASSSSSVPTPKKTVSVYLYDGVKEEYLLKTSSTTGGTVKDITIKAHQENNMTYSLDAAGSYFKMIAGIRDGAVAQFSGWVFFYKREGESNYTRSIVGATGIALQPGDSLIWIHAEGSKPEQTNFPDDLK